MKQHLGVCKKYQKAKEKQPQVQPQVQLPAASASSSTPIRIFSQSTLTPAASNSEKNAILDRLAARVCYEDARPFTLYDTPAMRTLLAEIAPYWQPPSAFRIANDLLDSEFNAIQQQVNNVLQQTNHWNIVIDGSKDSSRHRTLNLVIHTINGAFFWTQCVIDAVRESAEMISNWLIDQLQIATNDRFYLINSLSTDTCNVNRAVYNLLDKSKQLSHALFIPCDAHGLQLLILDIINAAFKEDFQQANNLVGWFDRSLKQLAALRDIQREVGKQLALVIAVKTRWGTQFGLIKRLLINKIALKMYAVSDLDIEKTQQSYLDIINNEDFWTRLEAAAEILQPIDDALKEAEADKSHLGLVYPRWRKIRAAFIDRKPCPFAPTKLLVDILDKRIRKQLFPIYYLAWLLMPNHKDQLKDQFLSL